jgi:ribosomal protein S18 acetylase RimI-like enzyme
VAVGRCWSSRSDDEIRILDIAVLTRFRRRGIASQVLRELGAQAVNVGLRLRLSVWHANDPAIAMYRNLGMNACGEHNGYHELEWSPANHVAFISQEAASHE